MNRQRHLDQASNMHSNNSSNLGQSRNHSSNRAPGIRAYSGGRQIFGLFNQSQYSRQKSSNTSEFDASSEQFHDALSDLPQNSQLKTPLMQNQQLDGNSNKSLLSAIKSNNNKVDVISSIHSYNEFLGARENHYLMDMPSPKFSSAMGGETEGRDEEINEILGTMVNLDHQALKALLATCNLDVTRIRDEMGYSLIHLAAYNNSEQCLDVLIQHIMNGGNKDQLNAQAAQINQYDYSNSDQDIIQAINRRALLKNWVNQPTINPEQNPNQNLNSNTFLTSNTPQTFDNQDSFGFTALHFASYHGNAKMIEMLVDAGANVYATNRQEINMLHVAAQGDSPYSIAYFRKMGISINSRDRENSSPLHWACISNSHTVIQYLLAWGSDINAKDSAGLTPLHLAVMNIEQHKKFSTIKKLIFKGASLKIKDQLARKPIDMAIKVQDEKIKKQLNRLLKRNKTCFNSMFKKHKVQQMKGNIVYPICFMILFGCIIGAYATVVYPNIEQQYLRIFLNLSAAITGILYLLSWIVNPGYLGKKIDGEFMLLLNKFDPNSLCPFCEVVQNPQSKHCYACNQCIEEFDHHCFWTNNCVGRRNILIYNMFLTFLTTFLTSLIVSVMIRMLLNMIIQLFKKDGEKSNFRRLVYPRTTYESEIGLSTDKYKSLDGISLMSANPVFNNNNNGYNNNHKIASQNTFRTADGSNYQGWSKQENILNSDNIRRAGGYTQQWRD
ncbi:dhhc zinc finger domain containing protein [Stylonychia lemnae]|uniref:Palmitoyltransferase n=1 Tax=Stylonychia lemnae TaxID=5949 RepID=A0A078B8D7_STYLE|nr:dhhc zinc finger domain containing protein [Stylonychia lemnae]|eukprot:CDW90669.1 dhhc zinc finger domain containing protein [Stylonychia lemnae]